ncbi:NADP-dependent oxidoreductase [Agrococcus versicolor]|uniref:NADP-dependent oxidoreductase n=1 Tax=Agrococcus versicolor TaxID=501482 RepID=A0ABN3AR94_9MICO
MESGRMRAVLLDEHGQPGPARVGEVDAPMRLSSEVLVDVRAAGVEPVDAAMRAGAGDAVGIQGFPWVGGHDLAGTVAEAAYELHELQPGDAVFGVANPARGWGSFAERVAVSSLCLARKPASLTWEEAAAVPLAALAAWDAVVRVARAHGGQRILVHGGASGAGHFAVQLARYFGARVVATAPEASIDLLRELGADEVVDHDGRGFADSMQKVDVVIDLAGDVVGAWGARSLAALRPGGLHVGVPTGSWPGAAADCAAAGMRSTSLRVEPDGANLGIVGRLIDAGDIRVRVDSIHPLGAAADAFARVESGRARGAVVLRMR